MTADNPFPFPASEFDAVYLGHVLEHHPWNDLPSFLDGVRRVAKPGAPILIVGPDVHRTLLRWKAGSEPWEMVESVMEHQNLPGSAGWTEAAHHWNCHQDRVHGLLTHLAWDPVLDYSDIIPNDVNMTSWADSTNGIVWPVVGKWHWQFAVLTYNRK